jgi:hypothetical protein
LAVVGLHKSFDCHNDDLYKQQIEPSARGAALIARLLHAAVEGSNDGDTSKKLYLWSHESDWEEFVDTSGRTYYHTKTDQAVDKPAEYKEAEGEGARAVLARLPPGDLAYEPLPEPA